MNPTVSLAAGALALLAACAPRPATLAELRQVIQREYADVPQIGVADLADWLHSAARPPPALLDVRSEAEFAVSHLAHAHRVDPRGPLPDLPHTQPVVAYCSVGYRSSAYARRLMAAGFQDVHQLDGSLFEWVNQGQPVYRDGEPVDEVHPYSRRWAVYLPPAYRPSD